MLPAAPQACRPQPVLRFAPSPNGELHLGHALSALTTYDTARRLGGRFLLRIEDIDLGRTREAYVAQIYEDLAWLGLTWETPVLRQSQRFAAYAQAAAQLRDAGVLYPCFATRSDLEAAGDDGRRDPDGVRLYPGLWRGRDARDVAARQAAGDPFALRLDMAAALARARDLLGGAALTFVEGIDATGETTGDAGNATGGLVRGARTVRAAPERWGDAVIVRKDTPASYHLAVVVDDAAQGVTHVTRGQDLFAATDLHRLLQVLLGLQAPVYAHHPLITDAAGRKLSKSAHDTSLRALRAAGVTAGQVRAMLGLD